MKTLLRAALLGSALACAGLGPVAAQDAIPAAHPLMMHGTMLNVSAYGEVKADPDKATITTGVVTEAQTAAEAMRLNRERMNQVIAALRRQGIEERDIQTTGLSLSPQYTYRDNQPPLLRGYQASNRVTVTVQDIARVGAAVDAVVSSGANQVDGISFGLRDPQTAENAARVEAVRRVRAKAELYAQATGLRLKGLKMLSEGSAHVTPPPMPMYRMEMAQAADAGTPVQPGQLTLRVDVQAVYELE